MCAKTNRTMKQLAAAALCMAALSSCATTGPDDPLRNTKKLAREGHVSLYNNGAFRVPRTSISLIPPGPSTMELAGEMAGVRAKESFVKAVRNAADSVYIVSEGTKTSYRWASGIHEGSGDLADAIRKYSRENSRLLVYKASDYGKKIAGESWKAAGEIWASRGKTADDIARKSGETADAARRESDAAGEKITAESLAMARDVSASGTARSKSAFSYAGKSFVLGYAAVPSKIKGRIGEIGEDIVRADLGGIIRQENERRARWSGMATDIIADTLINYGGNVKRSFDNARNEFNHSYRTTGLSLAALKSLRWVLQGVLWDATIEPAAKITAASVGYLGVNAVAFPTMVVVREGMSVTNLAVEVTWNASKAGYDLVAPTGTAAVASIYGLVDFAGSNLFAGTIGTVGGASGYALQGTGKVAGVTIRAGGHAGAAITEYIGVPLTAAGVAVGGGAVGTVVGAAGATTGATLAVSGEAASAGTYVFGNMIAGATLVGGTAGSTAGGAAAGVYELSKAVVVPTGYELGSGIVIGYGTMTHIAAHSILAVSDCSYMVLSLEGPRWVLYAVKGKGGDGGDMPVGAVVDLEKARESGEEIYYLPVSDGEMKETVDSVYDNLPELKPADGDASTNGD